MMVPLQREGSLVIDSTIVEVMPKGATILAAKPWGLSAWTKTAKIDVLLSCGSQKRYFLKYATGKLAKIHIWGEHYSASIISSCVPEYGPNPVGSGMYLNEKGQPTYFYIQRFHAMVIDKAPDPAELASTMAKLHRGTSSPNGMFGYPIVTGRGTAQRTEHWSKSWATQFIYLLSDLIDLDNQINGHWSQLDDAYRQLIEYVIPRLLGVLQSGGRSITPVLVHGDLWEGNVATDRETGKVIVFDFDECMYAHNELEMGTWRCRWAKYFSSPAYIKAYQREIEPSEPAEEFDDRNRLYAIKAAICDSAGHRGSVSRRLAYNDMLFLCEKYAPLDTLEKYDPEQDISVTGIKEAYDVTAGA